MSTRHDTPTPQIPESLPSPLRSIRLKCLDCCLGSAQEVELCTAHRYCILFQYRKGRRGEGGSPHSPLRIIRQYCLGCGEENSYSGVEACPMKDCPLYPYRKGTHPGRKGRILTEAEKAKAREIFAQYRRRENA